MATIAGYNTGANILNQGPTGLAAQIAANKTQPKAPATPTTPTLSPSEGYGIPLPILGNGAPNLQRQLGQSGSTQPTPTSSGSYQGGAIPDFKGVAPEPKTTPSSSLRSAVDNAIQLKGKPSTGDLAVGQVGVYKDSKGKDIYVIGGVNGKITPGTSSVSNAISKLKKVVSDAETVQVQSLTSSQKIEIAELTQTLRDAGLSNNEIKSIVNAEKSANKTEVKSAKDILGASGYQILSYDQANKMLTSSDVDFAGNKGVSDIGQIRSVLGYSGDKAQTVSGNIQQAYDNIGKFRLAYGLNQDYLYKDLGKTQTISGINDYRLYQALDSNRIAFNKDTGNYYINKEAGKLDDLGKGFLRTVTGVLARDTAIGDKAFVGTDSKGNLRIQKGKDGEFMNGNLVDTGEKLGESKIFLHKGEWDTKYNKAGYDSMYVQNVDPNTGEVSYTYLGTPNVDYTHIDKQKGGFFSSIAGKLALAAASYFGGPLIANSIAPLLGTAGWTYSAAAGTLVPSTLATTLAGALVGGVGGALTGENIISSAALAGLGAGLSDILSKAADSAGGWGNLFEKVKAKDFSAITDAAGSMSDPNIAKQAWDAAADLAAKGGTSLDEFVTTAAYTDDLANQGFTVNKDLTGITTDLSSGANVTGVLDDYVKALTGQNVAPGIQLGVNQAGDIIDATTGLKFSGPGVSLTGADLSKGINLLSGVGNQAATDALVNAASDPSFKKLLASTVTNQVGNTGLDSLVQGQWKGLQDTLSKAGVSLGGATTVAGAAGGASSIWDTIFGAGASTTDVLKKVADIAGAGTNIYQGIKGLLDKGIDPEDALAMADPYSKYRGQAATQLNALMMNPSMVYQLPGYQFAQQQGQQAVQRGAAATGQTVSGNQLQALQTQGSGLATDWFNNYVNILGNLSGASQGPIAGYNAFTNAAQNQSLANKTAMDTLLRGIKSVPGFFADSTQTQGT